MDDEPYESELDRKRRAAEEAQPMGTNPILDAIRANRQNFALSPGIEHLMQGSAMANAEAAQAHQTNMALLQKRRQNAGMRSHPW